MAAALLPFLSPRASKVLSPVCTLTQSDSSMTISVKHEEDPFIQAPEATYMSPYSQRSFDSNQRTRNQFRPRNATKGTTSYQLRQYAEATLGGGSLRKIVKLPEGEDENEWLAVNSNYIFTIKNCCSSR
jgi:MOB kinase activator 1